MCPTETSTEAVRRLFRRKSVVDLGALYRTLNTNSRMTVFRHLRDLGYLSSYSHAGRYYTLSDIPQFDADGLWMYQGIGFSKAGTLKNTARRLVESAVAGYTSPELKQRLRVRVQNTLLDLLREQQIAREPIEKVFLYVSREAERAVEQIAQRRDRLEAERHARPLAVATVIEILVEVIQSAHNWAPPQEIATRLLAREIMVTTTQVEEVFLHYGLETGKKRAT